MYDKVVVAYYKKRGEKTTTAALHNDNLCMLYLSQAETELRVNLQDSVQWVL